MYAIANISKHHRRDLFPKYPTTLHYCETLHESVRQTRALVFTFQQTFPKKVLAKHQSWCVEFKTLLKVSNAVLFENTQKKVLSNHR